MKILVTGGAGFIGSHFVKKALSMNHSVVVLDNLSRGHKQAIPDSVLFFEEDLKNYDKIFEIIKNVKPDAIVHFAAFAYVGESVGNPFMYYQNNVFGSLNLINAAVKNGVKRFIFSSTCSLYGNPDKIPINEKTPENPINPYAKSKLMVEKILEDYSNIYDFNYIALRYFNAAGTDLEGGFGESHDPETHLIPLVLQTALGQRNEIKILGDDYNTPDGTCVRDYIHVNDLAEAHLLALEYLSEKNNSDIINLGTGNGYSVKEIINSACEITKLDINYTVTGRREGDPAILVADNKKAKEILGWSCKHDLEEIISSAFCWFKNPKY